jgi:3-hydroxyacyl-CoA dehydrogenase/enoyl-CoA hydratase/3-hydroxybutyryl-CoA epimerase
MLERSTISWKRSPDGIVTLTFDDPNNRVNMMNAAYTASMHDVIMRLKAEADSVVGVIVTSGKSTFFAGGDIEMLAQVSDDNIGEFTVRLEQTKADLRSLETLGLPVVAALNGSALGGGFEIALACHRRVALANPKAQFGLPEVTLGLLPGGGGVTRITRLLGISDGLAKVLLAGPRFSAVEAKLVGLIDEIVDTPEALMAAAKAWIDANPKAVQRWDAPGYRIPAGAVSSSDPSNIVQALPAALRRQLECPGFLAPRRIVSAAVEGAVVDIDEALSVEGRYFIELVRSQAAKNMIKAFWFDLNSINAGGSRPPGYGRQTPLNVGIVGAGMMGAGIAYVSARSGLNVVLRDVTIDAANKGKEYSRGLLDKAVARGALSAEQREATLALITTTDDYAALAVCDLVIEAVFEDPKLKQEVFAQIEPVVAHSALLATNTSTLPITELAVAVKRREDFIGLHFFSPVDRMPLLEIVRGAHTSDAALARALDYASMIKKTPIVVRDSRGFFTSRVIGTFTNEALAMLAEGFPATSIEKAANQAGYPVGPLQLADELNMELILRVRSATRAAIEASGLKYERHPAVGVVEKMIEIGRPGRVRGAGFYEYDENGRRNGLWYGLAELFPSRLDSHGVDIGELGERMLVVEALESARCLEEGVLGTVADANIGSIMGIGYPAWTGGVLQYINGYEGASGRGLGAFVARTKEFAARYGPRFAPSSMLLKYAETGESI